MFMRCRKDIMGVNESIRFPILPSLVKCDSQERRRVADFGRFGVYNWLPWQHPLTDCQTNTRLNIYRCMSTKPENLMKIGLVGSESSLVQFKKRRWRWKRKKVTAVYASRPSASRANNLSHAIIRQIITLITCYSYVTLWKDSEFMARHYWRNSNPATQIFLFLRRLSVPGTGSQQAINTSVVCVVLNPF